MKLRKFSNLFLRMVFIFYLFVTAYTANKQRIKIGVKESDMSTIVKQMNLDEYKNYLNNYFIERTKDNEELNKYELDLYDYPYPIDRTGRSTALTFMINLCRKHLPNRDYDLLVLDDRILFNEIALMESEWVLQHNHYKHPSLELFHDLSKYISKKDLEIHDPKIVSGGIFEDNIIGIPYEFDFDVMYYRNREVNSKAYNDTQLLVDHMENNTWDELLNQMSINSQPLNISLADDSSTLNFVIEYTSNYYNLSSEYDPNYIKLFYNDTAYEYYPKIRNFVVSISKNSDPKNTALTSREELFENFVDNTTTFFKARASHSIFFKDEMLNSDILLTLPPKYQSATTHSYLVANKFSKIDPEILAKVALLLTDKDTQLFRAEKICSIPTFDFTKKDSDPVIQTYCSNNPVICNAIDKMKKLYIRDIFKSDYMTAFYEIICFMPIKFKNYFIDPTDLELIRKSFINMNEFITSDLGVFGILSLIIISLTIIIFIYINIMTYKFKEHPYIKVISPIFCNLIVLGCIINLIKIIKYFPPFSIGKIKVILILETIGTNLIYIPMFAVAYRIFRIYKTKTLMSFALNNKHLLIGVLVIINIAVIYRVIIVFTERFYYLSVGSVNISRIPVGNYTNINTYNNYYQIYFTTIVSMTFLKYYIYNTKYILLLIYIYLFIYLFILI
ncbi:hypothetical protein PIROE2DRAFT_61391 [Piromyces sp. E2]|nr:hypothetical protein PIROE2DRAFT_61391 [Piromyces sp. E2]|eukprot:OUM63268.1 hypothetical protein PIROE2DRAFT_61391 [Piromyces sp. E2]